MAAEPLRTVLRSATREHVIGHENRFTLIGERINPTGRRIFQEQLRAGDFSAIERDVRAQVAALKREPGRDIWLCGGGDLAAQLIEEIDEIQVKISPLLLGAGVPLVGGLPQPVALEAVDLRALPGGVALATYRRRRGDQL